VSPLTPDVAAGVVAAGVVVEAAGVSVEAGVDAAGVSVEAGVDAAGVEEEDPPEDFFVKTIGRTIASTTTITAQHIPPMTFGSLKSTIY